MPEVNPAGQGLPLELRRTLDAFPAAWLVEYLLDRCRMTRGEQSLQVYGQGGRLRSASTQRVSMSPDEFELLARVE